MCAHATSHAGSSSSKTLEGSLSSFNLFEILQFLRLGAMTGVLTVEREEEQIQLMVRDGKIVNSSIFTHRQRLGELLLVRGIVTRRELDEILDAKRDGTIDLPLGQVLVERGRIDEETLRQTLRLQLEEEIWALLNWSGGHFHFDPCEELDQAAPVVIELEIEPLILEGTRRQDEWQTISQLIPSDHVVPVPVAPESFHEPDNTLTPNEWRVLSLINGALSVCALVDRSGLGRFETHRILANFVQQEWIVCEPPDKAEERTSIAAERRSTGSYEFEGENDEGSTGLRWRRAKPPREQSKMVARKHETPIGLAAAVANELLVTAQRRHVTDPAGRWPLTPISWQRMTGRYPAADGVAVCAGMLDPMVFEDFWVTMGEIPARVSLAEDTFTALADLIGDIATALRDSMPSREWASLESRLTEDIRDAEVRINDLPQIGAQVLIACVGNHPTVEQSNGR